MSVNAHADLTTHHYEEFLSDSTECPTCRGLGRIKKGNEELVALIPVSDSRLKPRKTVLYVALAVTVCAIIGGLLLFFLLSRSITLASKNQIISPTVLTLDNVTKCLIMRYQVPINITNENFLAVKVSQLTLSSLLFGDNLLNTSVNSTVLNVPMRSTKVHYVTADVTVGANENIKPVVSSCQLPAPILWKLAMNFEIEAVISYLSHTETTSITLYNRKVCCHIRTERSVDIPPAELDCSAF